MLIAKRARRQGVPQALTRVIIHIVLLAGVGTTVVPFVWMLSSSPKTNLEVFHIPPTLIPPAPQWQNYLQIFKVVP